MARVVATETWQSATLAHSETWVIERGPIKIHNDGTAPDADDGGTILEGDSISFQSGVTVYYKQARGGSGDYEIARIRTSPDA